VSRLAAFFGVVWMLFGVAPAAALELNLKGDFIQGGLVVGTAPLGSRILLTGASVPVGANGDFLIAFGRDTPAAQVLKVFIPNAPSIIRKLTIKKRTYNVQSIEGLPTRSVIPAPEDLKRIRIEGKALAAARAVISDDNSFRSGFSWPAKGRVSGIYGSRRILNGKPRNPHYGVDVAAPKGTPVHAMAAGRIAFAHPGMFFNGKAVIIDHGLGLTSAYLHMSAITVKEGARVKKGDMIGRIGQTGRATGPHLHWGVRLRATPVDPALLVGPME